MALTWHTFLTEARYRQPVAAESNWISAPSSFVKRMGMNTDDDGMLPLRPCGMPGLNSLLQRVARKNDVRVAGELLPIIDGWPEIGLGKRPTPIESDAVVRAGAAQDKTIIHADRGKSARQDRLGAGVVVHEFMYAAIAIDGNALD